MKKGSSPLPADILQARKESGLTQEQASALIYTPRRTWQDWERGVAAMHPAFWELWQIKIKDIGVCP